MINFSSNKKKILIVITVILIVAIWIVGSIIARKEELQKKTLQTPMPSPTQIPYLIPESATIEVGGVEVNNFYKDAILTGNDGYALFDKTPKYKIAYIPVDQSFLISIIDNPFEAVRKEAERAFLQKLGVNQENACQLRVNIATNVRVDPTHAGQNYKLSFCE